MPMKFKLLAVFFAFVFSAGIISHETSHFELDHGDHNHEEHSNELSENCSTCLAEHSEFVQDESTYHLTTIFSDFLDVKQTRQITLLSNQLSIRAPPKN